MTLSEAVHRLKFPNPAGLPAALCVTDERRLPDPLPVVSRLPRGVGVLFRHYGAADRGELAHGVARLARMRRLSLVVASDWRLAAAVGADGVHLPEGLARSGRIAPLLNWARNRGVAVTMACHSPSALGWARRLRVDAVLLSPAFPTASHPGAPGIGALRFRIWSSRVGLPVYALGGVTIRNLADLPGAGIAAISGWTVRK